MTAKSKRIEIVWVVGAVLLLLSGCVRSKPERSLPAVEQAFGAPAPGAQAQGLEPTATPTPPVPTATPTLALAPATALPTAATVAPSPTSAPATAASPTLSPTAQPTAAPAASPTPASELEPYVVAEGDTLYAIAKRHGTTIAALQQVNGLGNSDRIDYGQTILLPADATPYSGPEVKTTVYWVSQGETLSSIARRYKTTVDEIMAANPIISNENQVYAGMRIVVPVNTALPSRVHTVSYGESLSSIATRYGVTVRSIVQANGLRNANQIYAGQRLVIPD